MDEMYRVSMVLHCREYTVRMQAEYFYSVIRTDILYLCAFYTMFIQKIVCAVSLTEIQEIENDGEVMQNQGSNVLDVSKYKTIGKNTLQNAKTTVICLE